MRRRALLALSGSLLAGSAGCLSGASGTDRTTGTATDETTTDPETTHTTDRPATTESAENAAVSVALDTLQPGLVTMNSPDSIAVHPTDGQYLSLDVTVTSGDAPNLGEFAFEFDGTEYTPEPMDEIWRYWRFDGDEGALYDSASGEGLLLFALPESVEGTATGESPKAALSWPGGEWRPDETLRRRLAAPEPELSVSVEIPKTVPPSNQPTITLTVTNEGDVAGRFVAGLNRAGPLIAHTPVKRISFPVPAGGTETWELTDSSIMSGDYPDENVGDGESDMTYYLDWSGGRVERHVRYAD